MKDEDTMLENPSKLSNLLKHNWLAITIIGIIILFLIGVLIAALLLGTVAIAVIVPNINAGNNELEFEYDNDEYYTVVGIGDCTSKNIVIPKEYNNFPVKRIAEKAFYENEKIVSVTIPSSVVYIDARAFGDCINLKKVNLKNGLERIGYYAFSGCINLEKINIPDSVIFIGEGAFYECNKLKSVSLSKNITNIPGSCFSHCTALKKIDLPKGIESIGGNAFSYCESLKEFVVPDGVKTLGSGVFSSCYNLKTIELPDTLTTIDEYAFGSCSTLKNITIPSNVYKIGCAPFKNCKSLECVNYEGTRSEWNRIQTEYPEYIYTLIDYYPRVYTNYREKIDADISNWKTLQKLECDEKEITIKCSDESFSWDILISKESD